MCYLPRNKEDLFVNMNDNIIDGGFTYYLNDYYIVNNWQDVDVYISSFSLSRDAQIGINNIEKTINIYLNEKDENVLVAANSVPIINTAIKGNQIKDATSSFITLINDGASQENALDVCGATDWKCILIKDTQNQREILGDSIKAASDINKVVH